MAALPSFVELMSSLGLQTDSSGAQSPARASSHSPSPSASPPLQDSSRSSMDVDDSPAIIISQHEPSNQSGEFKRRASSGNIRAARFSPYSSAPRRGSMSELADRQRDQERFFKAPKSNISSSRRSSANNVKPPPTPRLAERRSRRGSLERLNAVATSCTPISSFARRRSPHSSPTSPSFSKRQPVRSASAGLNSPVMLPTLPPMLAESFAAFSFPAGSDANVSESERRSRSPHPSPVALDTKDSKTFVKHHQAGLRISSFHRKIAPVA
ncbi:hypothetical protein DFH11DRAFT_1727851 [Phellopilus nigrolimitatus]|nr:hypothetical protein DFH11DRAFT_1727851 [Phellopilus nigrolimitatus]